MESLRVGADEMSPTRGIYWVLKPYWEMKTIDDQHWAYVLACIIGQVANAVWLWLGKEIDCIADRFRDDPRSSIKSALTNLGIVVGTAVLMPWAGVPLKAAIMMGLLQGAYSDSKLNKSTRAVWSPQERAEKTGE